MIAGDRDEPEDDTVFAHSRTRRSTRRSQAPADARRPDEAGPGDETDDQTIRVRGDSRFAAPSGPDPEIDDHTVRIHRSASAAEDTVGLRRTPEDPDLAPALPDGRRSARTPAPEQIWDAGAPRAAAPVRAQRHHEPSAADVSGDPSRHSAVGHRAQADHDIRSHARRRLLTVVVAACGVLAIGVTGAAVLVLSGL